MAMPDWSMTATLCARSPTFVITSAITTMAAAMMTGTRNVVSRKDFFLTLVRYSRAMTVLIVLKFIA